MNEEGRAAWLSATASLDSELAHELGTMLAEQRFIAEAGFLESCPLASEGRPTLLGQTLGEYKLVAQIGQGGMSSVWLAERAGGRVERRVAVKVLNIALMGREAEKQFKREGRILSALSHVHIAQLIEAGISLTGQPYLILEYVDGQHIDCYCERNRLSVPARVRLFLDVLDAVAQAHSKSIVHRDLKPTNVLVRADGKVKLLDFGIAKVLDEDSRSGSAAVSVRAFTPEYAAPEQLTGDPVTTATDVYGAGLLLYRLLTGQHPSGPDRHSSADAMTTTPEAQPLCALKAFGGRRKATLNAVLANRRGTSPEGLRRALQGPLHVILGKALKKEPENRYGSITAFADDLRLFLQDRPTETHLDMVATGSRSSCGQTP